MQEQPRKKQTVFSKLRKKISGRNDTKKKYRKTSSPSSNTKPGFIKTKFKNIKQKISNSAVGKVFGGMKKVGKVALAVGAAVVGAVAGAAVMGAKAAGGFFKASKSIGGFMRRGVEGAASSVNSYINELKSAKESPNKAAVMDVAMKPITSVLNFSPASVIAKFTIKLGWNALKFIGKKLWSGIKKVALGLAGIFGSILVVGKKFVNKVGYYIMKIGGWIMDKTYRFLIKPLASILTTVFGFTMAVVKSPVNFMKWLIPAVFDRIRNCLSAIRQATKRVLNATKSIFQKILKHPLTIALIIGGLFFLVWKFFGDKLSSLFGGIRDGIWSTVKFIATKVWVMVKTVANVLWYVGKFLFTTIEKITSPDGWLAKAIIKGVKIFMFIKRGITNLMKAAGTSTIDAFCEFLAGDTIGIAIRMIGGLVVKSWQYIKRVGIIRTVINLVKAIVGYFKMWGKLFKNLINVAWRLAKKILNPFGKESTGSIF